MKKIQLLALAACLLFQSCEFSDSQNLVELIDNYSGKIDLNPYKQNILRALQTSDKKGIQPARAERVIDDIMIETKRYLRDVAGMLRGGKGDDGLRSVYMNTFGLYKQVVEQDIPKLSASGSGQGGVLPLNEGTVNRMLAELQQKNARITRQLKEIEAKAEKQATDLLRQAERQANEQEKK